MAGFYILATVMFLVFLGGGVTIPLFPLYAQSLGASLVEVSWIAGGNSTVGLIANLAWGRVSDRIGRRKPILAAAMGMLVLTNLGASLADAWWALLPLRLIDGAAFGAYAVASLAMLGDILADHPHRARLVGAARMAGSLAFSIAVVSAGLVSQSFGLPTIYRLASAIFFLAFVGSLLLPERPAAARPAEVPRASSFAELLRGPMLPLLAVAASFNIPFSSVYFAAWPIWVSEGLGLGRATFSQLWGLAAFCEVPSLAIAGYLTDRFGRRFTFTLGMVLFAGVYGLYFLVATLGGVPAALLPSFLGADPAAPAALPALVLAQLLRGFAYAAFTATALTMAIEVSPSEARGRAAGLYSMAESLSNITGNYAGGPIAQAFGYSTLFAGAGCAVLLGAGYVRVAVAHPRDQVPARLEGGSDGA
jgi:MFS transporter, DHA1 family, multidrug resistance protein